MDAELVTVVSAVVSTAASVGAFVVALIALLRTRRNKAAVLDAQVEADFVARVLAKVLRLLSDEARSEQPGDDALRDDERSLSATLARESAARPALAELRSAVTEWEKLTPREQRMHDDGPWAGYEESQRRTDERSDEDPRRG
ncbi:hypothetical protein [Microbacterium sp. 179-I 3D4 NHS]|uniref:hypothetical protein n=1 Tax=Microbacterium sp. 179-I 3D4 NHS TaxID=3142381 RepID=UPI0039A10AE1